MSYRFVQTKLPASMVSMTALKFILATFLTNLLKPLGGVVINFALEPLLAILPLSTQPGT